MAHLQVLRIVTSLVRSTACQELCSEYLRHQLLVCGSHQTFASAYPTRTMGQRSFPLQSCLQLLCVARIVTSPTQTATEKQHLHILECVPCPHRVIFAAATSKQRTAVARSTQHHAIHDKKGCADSFSVCKLHNSSLHLTEISSACPGCWARCMFGKTGCLLDMLLLQEPDAEHSLRQPCRGVWALHLGHRGLLHGGVHACTPD